MNNLIIAFVTLVNVFIYINTVLITDELRTIDKHIVELAQPMPVQ